MEKFMIHVKVAVSAFLTWQRHKHHMKGKKSMLDATWLPYACPQETNRKMKSFVWRAWNEARRSCNG